MKWQRDKFQKRNKIEQLNEVEIGSIPKKEFRE